MEIIKNTVRIVAFITMFFAPAFISYMAGDVALRVSKMDNEPRVALWVFLWIFASVTVALALSLIFGGKR